MRVGLAGLLIGLAMAARAVPGGDPVAAQALWDWAQERAGDDLGAPVYLDAARELDRLRPWQPGYDRAQERVARIEAARRARLR